MMMMMMVVVKIMTMIMVVADILHFSLSNVAQKGANMSFKHDETSLTLKDDATFKHEIFKR